VAASENPPVAAVIPCNLINVPAKTQLARRLSQASGENQTFLASAARKPAEAWPAARQQLGTLRTQIG
jgi:hypothetical protein